MCVCVCVGDALRSYVPAPAGGWKWGTCLQVSQLFWEHWFHQVALNCCIFIHSISLQALKLRVFRSNTESNFEICRLQKCCVCVGDALRSYVPAPAGGWKWGTCLQVSQLFLGECEHIHHCYQ